MSSRIDLLHARRVLDARVLSKAIRAQFSRTAPRRVAKAARVTSWLNVLGTAIGERLTDGRYAGEQAVIVYVERKLPRGAVARSRRLPRHVDGIPVDVIEVGRPRAASLCVPHPSGFHPRPFPAGVSIGGGNNAAGTLGCLVRRGTLLCALSNYHVLGDLRRPHNVLPLKQPGFGDGIAGPPLGEFVAGVPLDFTGAPNAVDAAVASIDPSAVVPDIYRVGPISSVDDAKQDDTVVMHGKTSHYNKGTVVQTDASIRVLYGTREALLVNQPRILPQAPDDSFGAPGDSGAVILRESGVGVGLMVAREFSHGRWASFASPLPAVLEALGVTLA